MSNYFVLTALTTQKMKISDEVFFSKYKPADLLAFPKDV